MKSTFRYIISTAALAAAAQAVPFLAVGDSAELFLTGTAGVRSEDNILLSSVETDDVIYELTPGAQLVIGKEGESKARVDYKARRLVFRDHAVLNRWDYSVIGSADYVSDDEATKLRFDAAYEQLSDYSFDLRPSSDQISRDSILRRRSLRGGALADFRVFGDDAVVFGAKYDSLRYQTPRGVDRRVVEAPLAYYFGVAPGSQLGLGVRVRDIHLSDVFGTNNRDFYYFIGLRGKLSSSISGKVSIGYLQSDFEREPGQGTLGAESSLTYEITENTKLLAEASNDFGSSPTGIARRELRGSLGLVSQLNNDWQLTLKTGYTRAKYLGGDTLVGSQEPDIRRHKLLYSENWYEGSAVVTYSYNPSLSLALGYTHRRLLTNKPSDEFADNVFSFSIQLRY